jgi:hypothetical protein
MLQVGLLQPVSLLLPLRSVCSCMPCLDPNRPNCRAAPQTLNSAQTLLEVLSARLVDIQEWWATGALQVGVRVSRRSACATPSGSHPAAICDLRTCSCVQSACADAPLYHSRSVLW